MGRDPTEITKKTRSQTFQNSWTKGRLWLVFQGDAMFCSICKEASAVDILLSNQPLRTLIF